jgi:hypothetical protein
MSDPKDFKRQTHLAAMAVLVADGVIGYRPALDALVEHEAIHAATPEARTKWPKGYATARSMARLMERDAMSYPEAELTVADVITGGYPTDEAMASASKMIGHALSQLDKMRDRTSRELQQAIANPRRLDLVFSRETATPADRETPAEAARTQPAPPLMRRPARHP